MEHDRRTLYTASDIRAIEAGAIDAGISGDTLMQRAGAAAWRHAQRRWPGARRIVVACGGGNNGGDGWVIARLAAAQGCRVRVIDLATAPLKGDAALARKRSVGAGDLEVGAWNADAAVWLKDADLAVDAIFGTGLSRAPTDAAAEAITAIDAARRAGTTVLAVDLPSGLAADTGAAFVPAVQADLTVTFVGLKRGLVTGQGAALCGEWVLETLDVPESAFATTPAQASLLDRGELAGWLPRRGRGAHKGDHGHVLLIGGNDGTPGAILLAARAALRSGAGLVSVATREAHAAALAAAQPELMVRGVESIEALRPLLDKASVVAIGPGLGQDEWARVLWQAVSKIDRPLVVDADALNLLAQAPRRHERWLLTPHPGEAARLLGVKNAEVQADRYATAAALHERYGGTVVLKGAGSLVAGARLRVCPYGNPGMGVGGMGDALTGIAAAFLAQKLPLEDAAAAAVTAHALAGDAAARAQGERGLLPSDLIAALQGIVNP